MKVKVGNKIYDGEKEPVMLIFKSSKEREGIIEHLKGMGIGIRKYCQYPSTEEWTQNDYEKIKKWMLI